MVDEAFSTELVVHCFFRVIHTPLLDYLQNCFCGIV